jgi:hypothetical protein
VGKEPFLSLKKLGSRLKKRSARVKGPETTGFAVLVRKAKAAGKPGASPSLLRLPNQGVALVTVNMLTDPCPGIYDREKPGRPTIEVFEIEKTFDRFRTFPFGDLREAMLQSPS